MRLPLAFTRTRYMHTIIKCKTQLHVCNVQLCGLVFAYFPETGEDMCNHVEHVTKMLPLGLNGYKKLSFLLGILPELFGK